MKSRDELFEIISSIVEERMTDSAVGLAVSLAKDLPWDKMSDDTWTTVYHNFTHWIMTAKFPSKSDPQGMVTNTWLLALRLAEYLHTSCTELEQELRNAGQDDSAARNAAEEAMDAYRVCSSFIFM